MERAVVAPNSYDYCNKHRILEIYIKGKVCIECTMVEKKRFSMTRPFDSQASRRSENLQSPTRLPADPRRADFCVYSFLRDPSACLTSAINTIHTTHPPTPGSGHYFHPSPSTISTFRKGFDAV